MTQPLQVATQESLEGSQMVPPPQVAVPEAQRSASSSQVSTPLHAMASEHSRTAPPQVVPVQTSSLVQKRPSSQLEPSFGVQAEAFTAAEQTSH